MNRAIFHWHRFRFVLVALLIVSVLGSSSFGALPFTVDFCFVEDSGNASKSNLQLFGLGEELTEKDVDDDSEGKHLPGQAETSGRAFALVDSSRRLFEFANFGRNSHALNGRPIYLSGHSLLI